MATKGPVSAVPKSARSVAPGTAPAPTPAPASAPVAPSPVPAATPVSQGPTLKYLGFFRSSVIQFYIFLVQVYDHLKDKSGSFKPGIETVEGTVKTVVGPVVSKIHFNPDAYLVFVDSKVDGGVKYADAHTPEDWKRLAVTVSGYSAQAPEKVKAGLDFYKANGFVATVQSYYEYLLPVVLAYLATVWQFIMTLPLAPLVVDTIQPYAFSAAQQYNNVLAEAQKSDVPLIVSVTRVLPTVPLQKLKKSE